jgi:hypothetical protein
MKTKRLAAALLFFVMTLGGTSVYGSATKFVITGSGTQTAGSSQNLTIRADSSGQPARSYFGAKVLTFSGANASPSPATLPTVSDSGGIARAFGVSTVIVFTNGVATVSAGKNGALTLYRAETATVSVTDGTLIASGTDRLTVTVSPSALGKFTWSITSSQTNGVAFIGTNTLTAQDDWGNTQTSFDASSTNVTITTTLSGTITGLGSSGNNVLNRNNDFASGVADLTSLGMKYMGTTGSGTLTATGGSKTGLSSTLNVIAGTARYFTLSGSASVGAGVGNPLTITARDTSGNTATGYTGSKTLGFTGAGYSPDGDAPTVTNSSGAGLAFSSTPNTAITFTNGVSTVTAGGMNGVMRLYQVGTHSIAVGDGTINTRAGDKLSVTVTPAGLGRFSVFITSPQANGVAFTGVNTVTAIDSFGNTLTNFNAASNNVTMTTGSGLPGVLSGLGSGGTNVLNQSGDFVSGVANISGKLKYTGTVGSGVFTATSASPSKTGSTSGSIVISVGAAKRLVITGNASQVAGAGQSLTITAKDSSGNTVSTYTGDKTLYFSGSGASSNPVTNPTVTNKSGVETPFGSGTVITFANGVAGVSGNANGQMRLYRVGTDNIAVEDVGAGISSGGTDRLTVTVTADVLAKFVVSLNSPQQSGIAFAGANTITAQDSYGNTKNDFDASADNVTVTATALGGVVSGLGSAGTNVLNQFADFTSGVANLTGKLKYTSTVGTTKFQAVNTTSKAGTSGDVQIVAGGATRLVITGSSIMTAGGTQSLTISARDGSGNVVTSYTGSKSLRFSGADSSLNPAVSPTVTNSSGTANGFGANTTITFSNGVATVSGSSNGVMRLYRAQSAVISVTDGTISSNGTDQLTVTVSPASLGKFTWSITSPQTNGAVFVGANTLTAQDDWGNTLTAFDASSTNVTVTTSLSGTISGLGNIGNNVLNRNNDFASGVANLTALGMKYTGATGSGTLTASGGSKTGLSSTLVVTAGGPTRLVLRVASGDSIINVIAGATQNLRITAKDVSGNTVATYTGTKQLTFTGADSSQNPPTSPTVSNSTGTQIGFDGLTSITFTNGVAQISGSTNGVMRLYRTQTAVISVTDGSISSAGDDRLTATVAAGALQKFAWNLTSPQISGTAFTGINTLTAQDTWGNAVPTFNASTNNVTLSTSLPGSVKGLGTASDSILNRGTDFVNGVADLTVLGMKYTGAIGTGTFTAIGAGKAGTSTPVEITAGVVSRLVITGSAAQIAGTSQNLTITARDGSDNVVLTYTGSKTLSFSGATSSTKPLTQPSVTDASGLPVVFGTATPISFLDGVASVSGGANGQLRLYKAENAVISVTDGTVSSTGTDRLTVAVAAAALGQFSWTLASPQVNGIAFAGTNALVAQDDWGNTVATFNASTNNVTISTSLSALPSAITGLGSLGNNVLNRATDFVGGLANLTSLGMKYTGTAGTGTFTATSAVGSKTGVSSSITINNTTLTFASITPTEASRSRTVTAVLTGTNFMPGVTTPSFGSDITIDTVIVESSTQMTVHFTIGATATLGQRDVSVSNPPPGGGTATIPLGFRVKNIPTLVSISPATGIRGQTYTVVITGTNFAQGVSTIGLLGSNITINSDSVVNSTTIQMSITVSPSAADGVRQFTVTNSGAEGGTSNGVGFSVGNNPVPTLTSVSPNTAIRLQTLELTLKGTNFYNGISSVNLGSGITVLTAMIDSATQMRLNVAVTDSAATGARTISVVNAAPGGGTSSLTNAFTVTNPVPTLTGLSVQNGNRLQTLPVTLTGTRFVKGATTVSLGAGITVTTTAVQSPTEMLVTLVIDSSAALGARNVLVTNPVPGGGSAQLASAFTVNNPLPTITTLIPESTMVGSASASLEVNGTEFIQGSVVRLGSLAMTTALVNRNRLTATIPVSELDTARSFAVTVFNPTPGGGTSNTRNYTVKNPAPTLASILPASGSRLQTMNVVFTGTNFVAGVSTVDCGTDILVDSVTVNSATQLIAKITIQPTTVMGPRDVSVVNPAPGGGISEKRTFTVANNPAPTISTVVPASGARLARIDVVVTGTNFITGVTSADFGTGIVVNKTTINSPTQLTATITIGSAAATGARSVGVTNAAPGGGTATKASGFSVQNPVPTLASVNPTNAQQLETKNVVLDGSGFISGVTTLNMGTGITVNSQTVVSDTQITANISVTVSAATGPRDIWVTNLSPGGGTALLTNGFVVGNNPGPTILSVTPSTGKRLETLDLVIRGTNFVSGVTSVDLGSDITVSSVTVDSASRVRARITIGAGAATGTRSLYITNAPPGGGKDSLLSAFTVTNPVPTLAAATPSEATRSQTLNVALRGTNFISQTTTVNFGAGISVNSVTVDSATRITANISVGATATLGPRNLVVTNPSPGGGNSTPIAFTIAFAPPPAPALLAPTNGQISLPTSFTVYWDSTGGATNYHLQVSASSLFLSTIVDDTTLTTASRRIGPLLNNTTYYWHVRARNAGGTSGWSSTWSFTPSYAPVLNLNWALSFPNLTKPSDYVSEDYRIVGLPGSGASLVSNFLSGSQATDWQVYWDNGGSANYFVKFDGTGGFTFSTGRAYWLIRKGTWTVNVTVESAPLDTGGNALIPLHTGWNLITNPFAIEVPWTAVQTVNGHAATEPIWGFSGTVGFQQSNALKPYAGYYFHNTDGVAALKVPYAGTSGVLKQADTASADAWRVGIGVSTETYSEFCAQAGIMPDAEEGLDRYDFHKPRAIGLLPGIAFSRPDLDPDAPSFATDIRPAVNTIARWPFELTAPRGKEVTLMFDGVQQVPEGLEVYLVDGVHARYINVREEGIYPVTPVTERSAFTLLIGSHDAVTEALDTVVPHEFALDQNFPNPFNPATTIPIAVPVTGEVTVKIYSILGEEVRTLHSGVLERGRHWLTWDGRNSAGRTVATGMYLTRLSTQAGGSHVIKMLLLK